MEQLVIAGIVSVISGLIVLAVQKIVEWRSTTAETNRSDYRARISGVSVWEKLFITTVHSNGLKKHLQAYKARMTEKLSNQSPFENFADLAAASISLRLVDSSPGIKDEGEFFSIFDVITTQSHAGVVILGESGSGKSTSLKQVARSLCEQEYKVPILIELRNYQRPNALEFLLAQEIGNRLWLERGLKLGLFIILLDSINEIPPEFLRAFLNDVSLLRAEYPRNDLVVTCRPADYLDYFSSFAHFRIQPLSIDSIKRFLRSTLGDGKEERLLASLDERLLGFCENPYLLIMLVKTYKSSGALPLNRAKLYEKFINQLFLGESTKSKAEISINIKHDVLSDLAFYMGNQVASVDIAIVQRIIGKKLIELHKSFEHEYQTAKVLDEILSNGLLRLQSGNISFMHLSVQEFYTAHELFERIVARLIDVEQIGNYVNDTRWHETLRMLAGLLTDATTMIEVLRRKDLTLASECIYASAYVSPTLVDSCIIQAISEFKFGTEPLNYRFIFSLRKIANRRSVNLSQRIIDHVEDLCKKFASSTPRDLVSISSNDLLMLLTDPTSLYLIPDIIWTLGLRKEVRAVNPLIDILLDKGSRFRVDAARALGEIKDKRATAALLSCIKDDATNLQPHIFIALGSIADPSITPALINYLSNIDCPYRETACWALLGVVEESMHDFLVSNIYRGTNYARANFVYLLGQHKVKKGFKPLINLMRVEHDSYVKEDIAFALGEYGSDEPVPVLLEHLRDDDALVRMRVVEALGKLGCQEALEPMQKLLETENYLIIQESLNKAIHSIKTKII